MSANGHVPTQEEFGLELMKYAGRWVAVENRTVVADDPDLGNLVEQLNGKRDTATIFKVREDPTSPCIY
jgi:hypothetical protein